MICTCVCVIEWLRGKERETDRIAFWGSTIGHWESLVVNRFSVGAGRSSFGLEMLKMHRMKSRLDPTERESKWAPSDSPTGSGVQFIPSVQTYTHCIFLRIIGQGRLPLRCSIPSRPHPSTHKMGLYRNRKFFPYAMPTPLHSVCDFS